MSLTRLWYLSIAGLLGYGVFLAYSRAHYFHAYFFSLGVLSALTLALVSYPRKKP